MAKRIRGLLLRCRDGRWQVRVKIPGDGTRYLAETFDRQADALAWGMARRKELEGDPTDIRRGRGVLGPLRKSWAEIGEEFCQRQEATGRAAGTVGHLRRMVQALAPMIQDLADPGVRDAVRAWLEDPARKLAPRSHNRLVLQLGQVVKYARAEGYLSPEANPLRGIGPRKVPRDVKVQFSLDELRHLLSQGADHFWPLFALLVYTGARVGEAATIRWEDIEWDSRGTGIILFRRRAGRELKTGERWTPIPAELRVMVEPLAKKSGPVVPIYRGNVNRAFAAFLAAHGVDRPGLTPHSCRHTYVGMMTATGEVPGVVRLYVGHTSEGMVHYYAEAAARFRQVVDGWGRGELRIMEGVGCPWPRKAAEGKAAKSARTLREVRG